MSGARLAVAMDFTTVESFRGALEKLDGLPVVLKVGLRTMPFLSLDEMKELAERFDLFVDAKLHDIPTQVAEAAQVWESVGARYLTVHLSGGHAMLSLAAQAVRADRMKVAGVSVLTSLNGGDLGDLGVVPADCASQVVRLIRLGLRAGIRTFVCSVGELAALREELVEDFDDVEFITPGLVMGSEGAHSDQSRVFTVEDALREGADVLVMGRSIWKSADPRKAAAAVIEKLARA